MMIELDLDGVARIALVVRPQLGLGAQQSVEQQKGRMQGALEAILDRRDLDPATHRWDYDGKTVTLRAV